MFSLFKPTPSSIIHKLTFIQTRKYTLGEFINMKMNIFIVLGAMVLITGVQSCNWYGWCKGGCNGRVEACVGCHDYCCAQSNGETCCMYYDFRSRTGLDKHSFAGKVLILNAYIMFDKLVDFQFL